MSTDSIGGRPDLWVGHVHLPSARLNETRAFLLDLGMRHIFAGDDVAVLELRGGTHVVVTPDASATSGEVAFDLMVEDLRACWKRFRDQGLTVSEYSEGRIHDWFLVTEPGGQQIRINSSHVPDHSVV